MGTMKEKRTIQTVQKSVAAFFRKNHRMPSFSEMVGLLGVRSKSVVNFWIDKLIKAEILDKDHKGHLNKGSRFIWKLPILNIPSSNPRRNYDLEALLQR